MDEFSIPYGKTTHTIHLPKEWQVDLITPHHLIPISDAVQEVRNAIDSPIGEMSLEGYRGAQSVSIAINDKTRPVPNHQLIPPFLDKLHSLGIPPEKINFMIATGAHPLMMRTEFKNVLPSSILQQYSVTCHDVSNVENLTYLGQTSRGTPVWINSKYLAADIRIVVGNIEPHQFQGFSGGVKSAAIGLAGKITINRNHALMLDPLARLGNFYTNPARQDVEEIGKMIRVDFAINAILNDKKEIIHVLAGDPWKIMHEGIPLAEQACQVKINRRYDLVIASTGGHPKDINLYQAQKALANASLIIKPGGAIIIFAACPEGSGSMDFDNWIEMSRSLDDIVYRFQREGFQVGPHKAWQIARDASNAFTILISDMPAEQVKRYFLNPASNFPDALIVLEKNGISLRDIRDVAIMPYAMSTIPAIND
jgi:nickel-dependent lactate racemase